VRGYSVIDPRRALETARTFKPDLVIVDRIMSQEDGIEVATQLEADWALHGVPIVFLTSFITAEEARMAVAFTGAGFFRSRQAVRSSPGSLNKTCDAVPRFIKS
jgi:DNA-binding response OmpR family regulator